MATETTNTSLLPSLPSMSMITSFFTSGNNNNNNSTEAEEPLSSPTSSNQRPSPLKTSIRQPSFAERPPSPTKSVMFGGAEEKAYGSDDYSQEGSVLSSNNVPNGKRRKRSSIKPKTSYTLGYAPPMSGHRRKIRTRPLLQLQRLESSGRPKPTLEVIPSRFSPRLAKAIVKVFGAKHSLCLTDLVVVRAEQYTQDANDEEDETRDVLALICAGRKGGDTVPAGQAKIVFADGAEWDARQLLNGGYECINIDEHGLKQTVRWVSKKNKDGSDTTAQGENKRFNFSTIATNSRRHPVIANLSSTALDISDSYNLPPPAPSQRNSTVSGTLDRATSQEFSRIPSSMERNPSQDTLSTPETITTTPELRSIITATAAWVAVKEGWCPGFNYDDRMMRSTSGRNASPSKSHMSPPASPMLRRVSTDSAPVQRSSSFRQTFRAASMLRRQIREDRPLSSQSNTSIPMATDAGEDPLPAKRRSRADTTSTVIVHRSPPITRDWTDIVTSKPEHDGQQDDEDSEEDVDDVDDVVAEPVTSRPVELFCTAPEVSGTTTTAAAPRSRSSASSTRPNAPKYDTSSSEGSDLEQQKMAAKASKKSKKRVFKRLFCGMF